MSIFAKYKEVLIKEESDNTECIDWLAKLKHIPNDALVLIGCGSNSRVYKATQANGKEIALKIIEKFGSLEAYNTQANTLENEIKLVKSIDIHPHIIEFFDFMTDDSKAKLIIEMEYLEGGSLADKINCVGHLEKMPSLQYLDQILEGITFLHANKIYNSDITPEHILLTKNDQIKICGIAIQIATNTSSETASHVKGTSYYYMSPERLNGAPPSAENDMWSVGATFVKMVTGNTLNHNDKSPYPQLSIEIDEIFIGVKLLKDFIDELNKNDYRRQIISNTLCPIENRLDSKRLLEICKTLIAEEEGELVIPNQKLNLITSENLFSSAIDYLQYYI